MPKILPPMAKEAVRELLQHAPEHFKRIGISKRNSTFAFSYDLKTWMLKVYGTPDYEMKAQKEAFFLRHVFPLLYTDVELTVMYSGTSSTLDNRFILIRELLDAKPIDAVDTKTLVELIKLLIRFHESPEIRASVEKGTGFRFGEFGEIMGKTEGINNTPQREHYLKQAHEYWFSNIQRSNPKRDDLETAMRLIFIMEENLKAMPAVPALTHGDVKVGNLMRLGRSDRLILLDYENAFSFFPEYDFIPLMFAREVDRQGSTVLHRVRFDEATRVLIDNYYRNSVTETDVFARVMFLTSYAYLRLWNFAVRISEPALAKEVVQFAGNFLRKSERH